MDSAEPQPGKALSSYELLNQVANSLFSQTFHFPALRRPEILRLEHFMNTYLRYTLIALLSCTLVACDSADDDGEQAQSDQPGVATGANAGGTTAATAGTSTAATSGTATAATVGMTTAATAGDTGGDAATGGGTADSGAVDAGGADGAGTADGMSNDDMSGNVTTGGNSEPLPDEVIPELPNPFADAIPSPDANDPFGFLLEVDNELAVAGGVPTTPKNLRIDLVSNDWGEMSWAPSNGDPTAYRLYRSDGVIYTIAPPTADELAREPRSTLDEMDKYWSTTSFIDCNYTRFAERVHRCTSDEDNATGQGRAPIPGTTYSYEVTAVNGVGESSPSNSIEITYHAESGAPVPRIDDFYLDPTDRFAQNNDLSETRFFMDEFAVVFEDDFDGPTIDENKWTTQLTWGDTRIINGEQQYFVNTQGDPDFGYNPFKFRDNANGESILSIEAIPTPAELESKLPPICDEGSPSEPPRCAFLSGALSTHNAGGSKFGMIYGYLEGRMKVGGVPGMLSSFYLYHRYAGNNEPEEGTYFQHAPEIDVVEYLGENPFGAEDAFQTYHFADVNSGLTRSAPTMIYKKPDGGQFSDEYHTYGVLWEPQLVIWYIDGKEIKRLSGPQVSRQPMNIVNYLVAGSAWAPTPADDPSIYPLQYEVDYIRAYQRPVYGCSQGNLPADDC